MRTTRLSVGLVCMTYSHGSAVKSAAMAMPRTPPSPSVPAAFGTRPRLVFVPVAGSRRTSSRGVAAAVEHLPVGQGGQAPGQVGFGGDLVTEHSAVAQEAPVVTVTGALGVERLACASRARTWYR